MTVLLELQEVYRINSDEVNLLEKHKYEEINTIFWRNSELTLIMELL